MIGRFDAQLVLKGQRVLQGLPIFTGKAHHKGGMTPDPSLLAGPGRFFSLVDGDPLFHPLEHLRVPGFNAEAHGMAACAFHEPQGLHINGVHP